jgi:hypothetical protein
MEQGEIMDNQPASELKQEWLKYTANYKHFLSIAFGSALFLLFVNAVFQKIFTPESLLFYFFISIIFEFSFYGDVWTYFAKFSFDKEGLCLKIHGYKISYKNIRYEKIIYAKQKKDGISYNLALEVWFGRQLVVFWERLPSVEGRTEEIYYGEGMQAHYWTRKPGKVDELAGFIDMYNAQAKID